MNEEDTALGWAFVFVLGSIAFVALLVTVRLSIYDHYEHKQLMACIENKGVMEKQGLYEDKQACVFIRKLDTGI
jgi:hypothetical protein